MGTSTKQTLIFNGFFSQTLDFGLLIKSREEKFKQIILDPTKKQIPKTDFTKGFDNLFQEILVKVISDISLPKRFKPEKIVEEWLAKSKSDKKRIAIQKKQFDDNKELLTLFGKIFTKSIIAFTNDELVELTPLFEQIKNKFGSYLDNVILAAEDMKNQYSKVFLKSTLSSDFISITTKSFNALQMYLYYTKIHFVEFCNLLVDVFWGKRKFTEINLDSIIFFIAQPFFLKSIFELIFDLFKLQLFIIAWNSKTAKEIFAPKTDVFYKEKLDYSYYQKSLNKLAKNSDYILFTLLDIAYEEKRIIQFPDDTIEDNEVKKLISRIVHLQHQ